MPTSLECEVSDIIAKEVFTASRKKNQIGDGIFTENLLVYHQRDTLPCAFTLQKSR